MPRPLAYLLLFLLLSLGWRHSLHAQGIYDPYGDYPFNHILFSIDTTNNSVIVDWRNFIQYGYIDGDNPAAKVGDTIYYEAYNCILDTAGLGPVFVPMNEEAFCMFLMMQKKRKNGVKFVKISVLGIGDERVSLSISFDRHSVWKHRGTEECSITSGFRCSYIINVTASPYVIEDGRCEYTN